MVHPAYGTKHGPFSLDTLRDIVVASTYPAATYGHFSDDRGSDRNYPAVPPDLIVSFGSTITSPASCRYHVTSWLFAQSDDFWTHGSSVLELTAMGGQCATAINAERATVAGSELPVPPDIATQDWSSCRRSKLSKSLARR